MKYCNSFILIFLILALQHITYADQYKVKKIISGDNPFVRTQSALEVNNIRSFFWNTGVFNRDMRSNQAPGFEWPKNSGKFSIFTTGLTIAAHVNNQLRMAAVSYNGEYEPGYCVNGVFYTNSNFKLYRVTTGDNQYTNPDWANWGLMVPYGAPFKDMNNNGIYEPAIDIPGVIGANQTIFVCLSDANPLSHDTAEGFGGGTLPLFSEMHLTAWAYNAAGVQDIQFVKFVVINKSTTRWDSTICAIVCDPDLGDASDDYIGCDTVRSLGFCFNAYNNDGVYGVNPPAVGIDWLTCSSQNLRMKSFIYFTNISYGGPTCENDPSTPLQAHNYLRGFKRDGTPWLNPYQTPSRKTKYCYPGIPGSYIGWHEGRGRIENCGGDTTGYVTQDVPADRRFVMSSGVPGFIVNPGDTKTVIIAQMIARGADMWNSVVVLKQLDDVAQWMCDNGFVIGIKEVSSQVPSSYALYQNYPNPFNPATKIRFQIPLPGGVSEGRGGLVTLIIYDILGQEIATLVNEPLKPGTYEVEWDGSNYPSGVYYYKLTTENYSETRKMILIK